MRRSMIDQAKTEWSHRAVVQLMFHACAPDATEPCSWDPGLLHHPLSDAQWRDLITDGGALNRAWKTRLDELVPFLQQLQDDGIAPLFRPHHEMNQGAFWWGGRPGKDGTRRLFQITHDYLAIEKKLDGIVWVWDVQDLTWDLDQYDPGEAYYDLAALDVYGGNGFTTAKYDADRNRRVRATADQHRAAGATEVDVLHGLVRAGRRRPHRRRDQGPVRRAQRAHARRDAGALRH